MIITGEKTLPVPFFSLCFLTLNCMEEKSLRYDSKPLKDLCETKNTTKLNVVQLGDWKDNSFNQNYSICT